MQAFKIRGQKEKVVVSGWCLDGNTSSRTITDGCWSAADVLMRSLKSSILSSTSFQMGKTFWWVVSAAVEQSRGKANMVAQGDGKFGHWGWHPRIPPNQKKKKVKLVSQEKEFRLEQFPLRALKSVSPGILCGSETSSDVKSGSKTAKC